MSTFMANKATVVRKWYILDAAEKPLGRTAGDFVIVINADKAVLTGKKLIQKYYRTHSGYPGHLHETQYKTLMATKPELAMELAVKGMLGKNPTGKKQLERLKVYKGAEHKHAAQKPEIWE